MEFLKSIGVDGADLALATFMAVLTIVFTGFQYFRALRQRTSELYGEFYDADHYRRVVMPVYRLMRKLQALDGPEREAYWRAVVAGWDRSPDRQALYDAFVPTESDMPPMPDGSVPASERDFSAMIQHFYVESSIETHTEHEALTAFLYFWVRAYRLLHTRLISKHLFKQLFCNSFAYYHEFIDELRIRVEDVFANEPPHIQRQKPAWIAATRYVEDLLEPAG